LHKINEPLATEEARKHYIVDQVVPYISHMSSEEVKEVAFEPKPRAQEICQSLAMIVIKQSGRLPELARYRHLIREAVSPKFADWERELASELQCIATSIVISDLVGETFIGDEDAYDFNGVPIEVTDDLVEMVSHTWNQKTLITPPVVG